MHGRTFLYLRRPGQLVPLAELTCVIGMAYGGTNNSTTTTTGRHIMFALPSARTLNELFVEPVPTGDTCQRHLLTRSLTGICDRCE